MELVKGGGDMIIAFDGRKYDTTKCILNPLKAREQLERPKKKESCNSQGVM